MYGAASHNPYASADAEATYRRRRRPKTQATTPAMPLSAFIREAWPVIEPGTEYIENWHIAAIAEHLTAVTNGEIRDLIINMPPRFMKSTIVSVMWPVWTWTFKPSVRWLTASYAMPLSIRDALKSRRLIRSSWFQSRYGTLFHLTGDQNQKSRYENDKAGYRLATSTGASTTGEGGDALILDDPHNVKQAESEAQRQSTLDWIDMTWSTRRNDPKRSSRVVVMQRLHEADATGHLLAQGGWEHLCLPQEYEPTIQVSGIGWSDPRTQEGELLWPERFGLSEVVAAKRELGSYGYAGQHQQSPQPKGGGTFKREWWGRYRELPQSITRVALLVDSAFKEGVENDYSVCAAWATDGMGTYYVLDLWRNKLSYPKLMQALHDQYAKHQHWAARVGSLPLVIEDKASGQSAIQTLSLPLPTMIGVLPALPVLAWDAPSGMSKQARAEGVTPTIEAGRVLLPLDADWVEDFIVEHEKFPAGAHDDQVDTTSMALMYFASDYSFGPLPDDVVHDLLTFTGV